MRKYKLEDGLLADMFWRGLTIETLDKMASVDPKKLVSLVKNHNWVNVKSKRNDITIWQRKDQGVFHQITIPLDKNLSDYHEAMIRAIYSIYLHDDISLQHILDNVDT